MELRTLRTVTTPTRPITKKPPSTDHRTRIDQRITLAQLYLRKASLENLIQSLEVYANCKTRARDVP
jgi:hypothetical protein